MVLIRPATQQCDFCRTSVGEYVDGKTIYGPWANMCLTCYKTKGVGRLGLGLGQHYKAGIKVAG